MLRTRPVRFRIQIQPNLLVRIIKSADIFSVKIIFKAISLFLWMSTSWHAEITVNEYWRLEANWFTLSYIRVFIQEILKISWKYFFTSSNFSKRVSVTIKTQLRMAVILQNGIRCHMLCFPSHMLIFMSIETFFQTAALAKWERVTKVNMYAQSNSGTTYAHENWLKRATKFQQQNNNCWHKRALLAGRRWNGDTFDACISKDSKLIKCQVCQVKQKMYANTY